MCTPQLLCVRVDEASLVQSDVPVLLTRFSAGQYSHNQYSPFPSREWSLSRLALSQRQTEASFGSDGVIIFVEVAASANIGSSNTCMYVVFASLMSIVALFMTHESPKFWALDHSCSGPLTL